MANISTGITLTFDSYFTEIISINLSGMSRPAIDITHMGTTGAREFMPATLVENGTVDVEFAFDPADAPEIQAAVADPVVYLSCVITFPAGVGTNTITGDAFMTDFSVNAQLEEKLVASATLTWAGAVVFA